MTCKNWTLLAACLSELCLAPVNVSANTITVTNTNDAGSGSLRQALADVIDGGTVKFDRALNGETIMLASGELEIGSSVTIRGPGANLLAVSRDPTAPGFRIFHVMPGHTVTIQGLTVENGNADEGGGILNDQATLTVIDCSVINNAALTAAALPATMGR